MLQVINTAEKDIVIPFEGWTYTVPSKKPVLAEEVVADFLHERYPFVEVTKPTSTKGPSPVPQVSRKKTPVYSQPKPTSDMVVKKAGEDDETSNFDALPKSGQIDKDGVEWTGEGVEIDEGSLKI